MPHKKSHIIVDKQDCWEDIIESVDKTDVPVQCLKRITIKLEDGKRKQISVLKLRKQGLDDEEIEEMLNKALFLLGDAVKGVDFFVDVKSVAEIVQPETDLLLNFNSKEKK